MEKETQKHSSDNKLANGLSADNLSSKTKSSWLNKDEVQNVSAIDALIRAVLVIFIPIISVCLDWYLGLHTMYFIAPVIVYFAVTAMTRNCPVKKLFSRMTGN